jgi:hypothetical protein
MKNAHPKVQAVGLAGAVTTLVIAFLHGVVHFDPTPAEVAAGTTVLVYFAGYLKR